MEKSIFEVKPGSFIFEKAKSLPLDVCREMIDRFEKHGDEQLHIWRRSYDTPPPPISDGNKYNPNNSAAYADLAPELLPSTECLKDVVERMLPYWFDSLVPDLRADKTVLVAAHGNSLRALVKHLDNIADADISELNIPTGMPLHYRIGADMRPVEAKHPLERALDPEAAAAGAAEVAAQAGAGTT
jgi:2,3-bisphosphoglycerate-dependent phosphoglycerate mutase